MRHHTTRLPALLLLVMALQACVLGNVREDDPYAARVRQLESQIDKLERILDNQSLLQLLDQVQQLQADIREMRGEVEVLQNQVNGANERQRDIYLDLDQRLQALESSTGSVATTETSGRNDRETYQAAFGLLRESRYGEAEKAFEQFLKDFPQSALLPNAVYWLGEIHYVNKSFAKAVTEFRRVVESWSSSNKVADAWLKLGYCHYELKQWAEARQALETVRGQFPDHPSAALAAERLERMTKEGH